jgi:hypothetical protein
MTLSSSAHINFRFRALALLAVWGIQSQLLAQVTPLDFSSASSSSELAGVTTLTTTDSFVINRGIEKPYSITPPDGENMYRIIADEANGASVISFMETGLGLGSGGLSAFFGSTITNISAIEFVMSLNPGTYSFAWAYAANDYQPFNDGVAFYFKESGGTTQMTSLARNGESASDTSGPSAGTQILGSYGSTDWNTATFTISSLNTYSIGFFSYNVDDELNDPVMYVSMTAGSFTGTPVELASIPEPGTYAAIFGALALVGSVWSRRRLRV